MESPAQVVIKAKSKVNRYNEHTKKKSEVVYDSHAEHVQQIVAQVEREVLQLRHLGEALS